MRTAMRLTIAAVALSSLVASAGVALAQYGGPSAGAGPNAAPGAPRSPTSPFGRRSESNPRGGTAEVEEWGKQLRGDDPVQRLEAVKSLATSQEKSAVQHLVEATADPDPRVKLKAIDALGTLRASDATPVLIQTLYLRDSEPWLKQRVLVALGKIGDNRAARPIADYLSRDTDKQTLGTAIFALGEIGDRETVSDLQRISSTSSDERLQQLSQDAIAKINQKQINPEIQVKALREREGDEPRPAGASAGAPVAY
ncbi:MAG TPA: HEAT repeat domain-containing protein [Candidatus Binatia bacterium]|nr:HEAT repeat domain-containing protein [Candidatus Binatia bacterium]